MNDIFAISVVEAFKKGVFSPFLYESHTHGLEKMRGTFSLSLPPACVSLFLSRSFTWEEIKFENLVGLKDRALGMRGGLGIFAAKVRVLDFELRFQ